MCFEWWALVIAFVLGLVAMLAFWLTLARIAMGDMFSEGHKTARDEAKVVQRDEAKVQDMGVRGNGK